MMTQDMKFIVGRKIEMRQEFRPDGTVVPVTLVMVEPNTITAVRTQEKDGYVAIQVGVGSSRHVKKPQIGHTKAIGRSFADFREFRVDDVSGITPGQVADVTTFAPGDVVNVVGTSKGKGFQGVVKRHGFHGHPATHGHKDQLRMPGSIGSKRQGPVAPGKRMAGRMGGDRITVSGLEVVSVDAAAGILALTGAVPGARNGMLLLSSPGTQTYRATQAAAELSSAPAVEVDPAPVEAPAAPSPEQA